VIDDANEFLSTSTKPVLLIWYHTLPGAYTTATRLNGWEAAPGKQFLTRYVVIPTGYTDWAVSNIIVLFNNPHMFPEIVALGGLHVSVLATRPKGAGSNPAEDERF
jgi:hypothetical protein